MLRVSTKSGKTFFANHKEKQDNIMYFCDCSEAFQQWEKDDEGMLVKKNYRREVGDKAFDRKEIKSLEYMEKHFLEAVSD